MIDAVSLQRKAREIFINARAKQEADFDMWKQSLLTCSKERVLDKIPFPVDELSLQTLVPEWYVDVPDPDIASKQVEEANNKINQINIIIDQINSEGLALLTRFNEMNAGGSNGN